MSLIEERNNLLNKINESERTKLANELSFIQSSLYAVDMNYQELIKLLESYKNPKVNLYLWEWNKRNRINEFYFELSRLLHNYLAAAGTFRDHCRNITRKVYKNHPFIDEYNLQIKKRFAECPLSNFIINFRNNYLHLKITGSKITHNIHHNKIDADIFLVRKTLLKGYQWNSKSKQYIKSMPDEILLSDVIKSYHIKIRDFYIWYESKFIQNFKKEFDETYNLKVEWNELPFNYHKKLNKEKSPNHK